MRRVTSVCVVALTGALAVPLAHHVLAEDPPTAQRDKGSQVYFETTQVNLINVDVYVTDKAGNPVLGLTRGNFQLFEDEKPVEITNFFVGQAGAFKPPETPTSPAATSPPALPAEEDRRPPEQRLWLVIFIDNNGITPSQRNSALDNMQTLLSEALRTPGTQIMVVSHAQFARIRQPFTNDPNLLAAAFKSATHDTTDAVGASSEVAMIERIMSNTNVAAPGSAPSSGPGRGAEQQDFDKQDAISQLQSIQAVAEAAYEKTRATVASVRQLADSIAGLPGRKAICYVGNGIPIRPGQALLQKWEAHFGSTGIVPGFSANMESTRYSVAGEFRDLAGRAIADRVTFYALDASGGAAFGGGVSGEQVALEPDPGINTSEAMSRQFSLQYLAGTTGGDSVIAGPGAPKTLTKVARDFDTYYSLAYAAPRIGDGRTHAISVKVNREGVKVRYGRHYLDKSADDRMAERSLSALLYESGMNSLDVDVTVGSGTRQKNGAYLVPVLVTVPFANLALLPNGDAHQGGVSVWLAAKDEQDRITAPMKRVFPLSLPNQSLATALGQSASITFQLLMRPGPQTIAVSLRDDVAQAESTVTVRFTVGPAPNGHGDVQGSLM